MSARGLRALAAPVLLLASLHAHAETARDPAATVAAFYAALAAGDAAAAQQLLAPDAIVVEGGVVESRSEYVGHHLALDIQFARALPPTRSVATPPVPSGSVAATRTAPLGMNRYGSERE